MQALKQNKMLLILFVVSLVAFLVYQFGGTVVPSEDPSLAVGTVEESITQDILSLLDKMQQAQINSELFTATSWTSLVDYSIDLPSDTPGRLDLFSGTLQGNAPATISTPSAPPVIRR